MVFIYSSRCLCFIFYLCLIHLAPPTVCRGTLLCSIFGDVTSVSERAACQPVHVVTRCYCRLQKLQPLSHLHKPLPTLSTLTPPVMHTSPPSAAVTPDEMCPLRTRHAHSRAEPTNHHAMLAPALPLQTDPLATTNNSNKWLSSSPVDRGPSPRQPDMQQPLHPSQWDLRPIYKS